MPIPVLVKHCALSIYKSGYCKGTKVEQVQESFDIAVSRLIEYGFLWKNAWKVSKVDPSKIKLTAKGKRAEHRHQREGDKGAKTKEWNALYKLIQEDVEEDDSDGATSQDAVPAADEPLESRTMQQRRRLAQNARRSARRRPKRVRRAKSARRG
jgi:hypothetical protein